MRILAVAERLFQASGDGDARGELGFGLSREPGRDGSVVGGGSCVSLGGQPAPEQRRGATGGRYFGERAGVLIRVGQHHDEIVVFGGGADQGGAADVDVLDAVVVRCTGRDSCLERVEVDRHQIDGGDVVDAHLVDVFGEVPAREDAAVDLRHQGFDAAVHDLGEAGMVGHVLDRHACVSQGFG